MMTDLARDRARARPVASLTCRGRARTDARGPVGRPAGPVGRRPGRARAARRGAPAAGGCPSGESAPRPRPARRKPRRKRRLRILSLLKMVSRTRSRHQHTRARLSPPAAGWWTAPWGLLPAQLCTATGSGPAGHALDGQREAPGERRAQSVDVLRAPVKHSRRQSRLRGQRLKHKVV